MRTPGHDEDLALGFLFTEGILTAAADVAGLLAVPARGFLEVTLRDELSVDWRRLERHFYTSSSCGVCGKASVDLVRAQVDPLPPPTTKLPENVLTALPARLRAAQDAFTLTGGLHAAGLFSFDGTLLALREDVGRHNAVDKVIARHWRAGHSFANHVLMLSGRASFELIQKAALARIPVVAAVGAPSSLAIELAESLNITLAGFVRHDRWNLYCGESISGPA